MALFGDLEHHAFTDLAKVIRTQSGSLFLHEAYQGRTLELTMLQGQLLAMYVDGFPVVTPEQVSDILQTVHARARGAFEFQKRTLNSSEKTLYLLSLQDLLQTFAETHVPDDQLPHVDTRFRISAATVTVPPSLTDSWNRLASALRDGATAAELSRQTGQPERDLQVILHRLRAVDLIAPMRSVPTATPVTTPHPLDPAELIDRVVPAPLINRLLGALRRLGGARA